MQEIFVRDAPTASERVMFEIIIKGEKIMGMSYEAICENCGEEFGVNEGGGMTFFLLKCDLCGQAKNVSIDLIRKARLNWDDHKGINKLAGSCACGGNYDVNAKSRCPKCNSNNYHQNPDPKYPICHYD